MAWIVRSVSSCTLGKSNRRGFFGKDAGDAITESVRKEEIADIFAGLRVAVQLQLPTRAQMLFHKATQVSFKIEEPWTFGATSV